MLGPTLLFFDGADTFVEDTYFIVAPAAVARRWNVLLVDLPGQGILPMDGRIRRPDVEKAVSAVVDAALGRPEVDARCLAAMGISAGGYIVPRAAGHDSRLKAAVTVSMLLEFEKIWPDAYGTVEESFMFRAAKALVPGRRGGAKADALVRVAVGSGEPRGAQAGLRQLPCRPCTHSLPRTEHRRRAGVQRIPSSSRVGRTMQGDPRAIRSGGDARRRGRKGPCRRHQSELAVAARFRLAG